LAGAQTTPTGNVQLSGSASDNETIRCEKWTSSPSRLLKKGHLKREFQVFEVRHMLRASSDGALCERFDLIFDVYGSFPVLQADSSRCGQNLRDANEIVGGGRQQKEPFHQVAAAMAGLAQAADRLHPPERFFDPLALDRADAIAGMPGPCWP
jgi:hypothetical protein